MKNGLAKEDSDVMHSFTERSNVFRYVQEMHGQFVDALRVRGVVVIERRQPVVQIRKSGRAVSLELADGTQVVSDIAFIATGTKAANEHLGCCCHDIPELSDIPNPKVKILGSKLSAIYAALYLGKTYPGIKLQMVSYSGELPPIRDNTLSKRYPPEVERARFEPVLKSPVPAIAIKRRISQFLRENFGDVYPAVRHDLSTGYARQPGGENMLRVDMKAALRGLNGWDVLAELSAEEINFLWCHLPADRRAEVKRAVGKLVARFVGGFPTQNSRRILDLMDRQVLELVLLQDADPDDQFDLVVNAIGRAAWVPPFEGFEPGDISVAPAFSPRLLSNAGSPLDEAQPCVIVHGGRARRSVCRQLYSGCRKLGAAFRAVSGNTGARSGRKRKPGYASHHGFKGNRHRGQSSLTVFSVDE